MPETPENVVWLHADHYPYAHHVDRPASAPDGPVPETPTFDRLVDEGVHFGDAYSVNPLCAPARASFLTGQYPHKHGLLNNAGHHGANEQIPTDVRTYSHALRDRGVRPAYFGKWHVGTSKPGPDGTTAQDYGFEGWSDPGYGYPYNTERYAEYLEAHDLPEPVVDVEWVDPGWSEDPDELLGRAPLVEEPGAHKRMHTTGVFETPVETHEAHFVTHLANEWIADRVADGEQFFARVDVWGPHHPYWVPPDLAGTVDSETIPEYPSFDHDLADRPAHHVEFNEDARAAETWDEMQPVLARCYEHVHAVDRALGTVLDTLDRLGIADETLVIYSADHGDILGAHGGSFDKGWLMVEETMRIPMAMRWPDGLPAGATSDALVSNLDVVPTLYEAGGTEVPDRVDGESLLGLARDPDGTEWRDDLFSEHHGHYGEYIFQRFLRHDRYKYVAHLDDTDELYDLEDDPYELENSIDDPDLADVRAELRRRLVERMDETDDDGPDAMQLRRELTEE
jgi:arylsulfatase A-like enzyme